MSYTVSERFLGTQIYEPENANNQEKICKQCIDYATNYYNGYRRRQIKKITLLVDSYNGTTDAKNFTYLNETYGKANLAHYVDYRLGRPKVDALVGEFLARPLNGTIYTINKEAKSRKLQNYEFTLGRWAANEQLEAQKQMVGYDVFEGMQLPKVSTPDGPDQATAKPDYNIKETNERIMQTLVKMFIEKENNGQDAKSRFASNYLDVLISAECFGKVDITRDNKLQFREIDPRNALFEEIDRDPFMSLTPYIGEARLMFIHDILSEFELTPTQKQNLYEIRDRWDPNVNTSSEQWRNNYRLVEKNLAVMVYTIEWYVPKPFYTKVVKDPNNPNGQPYRKALSTEYYNKNYKQILRDVENGKYTIETKYKRTIWETTRIGADMYVNMREKPNIIGSLDNPYTTKYSYTGMLLNTRDGVRISLLETLENISRLFNMVMFQLGRELAKAKGKVVTYDRAYLPKGKTMKDVMYKLTNDGIYDYDSSADGNMSGTSVEVNGSIREIDLGISQNVQVLLTLKVQLQDMADRLSGISNERVGDIAASATVGNTQTAIQGSRNVTGSLNYFFDRYVENVVMRAAEYNKIIYGFLNTDEGGTIIGDDAVGFLKVTKDIAADDYGYFLSDGRKEDEIRAFGRGLMEFSLNANQLHVADAMQAEMSETLVEYVAALKKGWKNVQDIAKQQVAQEQQAAAAQQQQAQEGQAAMQERQFDQQKELANVKGQVKIAEQTNKAQNQHVIDSNKSQQEFIKSAKK